ncbi:hypothetical protein WP50_06795 [Lactiplantibacillus plantarum]|nr:hypothetical protein WP50_06795 [Lactiplantibacillus plantarum]
MKKNLTVFDLQRFAADASAGLAGTGTKLGTGRVGEESQKDLPDGFTPVYRQTPWFIPADDVDTDLSELYGMPKIEIDGHANLGQRP